MADDDGPQISGDQPTVRSRWVWGGLLAMIVGAIVVGVGVAVTDGVVSAVGAVVLVAGGAAAMRGRILNDVRAHPSVGQALTDVEEGNAHAGADPMDRVEDEGIRDRAREMTQRKRELLHPAYVAERAPLWPLGVGLLFVCAAWLVIATWAIDPFTPTGQGVGLRDSGIAVVLGVVAAWMRRPNSGPAPVAWGVSAVCGVALVLLGSLTAHDSGASTGSEIATGVVVLVASTLAVGRARSSA